MDIYAKPTTNRGVIEMTKLDVLLVGPKKVGKTSIVKSLKTEPGPERIIVPDLVNLVVVNVQPLEGLGDEGKVKPLKRMAINILSFISVFNLFSPEYDLWRR